jgi:hypothetical protein
MSKIDVARRQGYKVFCAIFDLQDSSCFFFHSSLPTVIKWSPNKDKGRNGMEAFAAGQTAEGHLSTDTGA